MTDGSNTMQSRWVIALMALVVVGMVVVKGSISAGELVPAEPVAGEKTGDENEKVTTFTMEVDTTTQKSGGDIPEGTADTLEADAGNKDNKEDFPRLTEEEYEYAGGPRYTVTGDLPYRETHVKALPLGIMTGAVAGMVAGIHIYQQNAWWSNNREPFHFTTDWHYAAQADKIGHMFSGYFTSYIGYEALVASGFKKETAGWLAPSLALGFMTYVEIEDGYGNWGFDPTDQAANAIGTGLFAAQQFVPWLENIRMKWSYWPTNSLNQGTKEGHTTIVIDDYNGQAVWYSFKMGNILPESIGWPKWLRLAFGYGTYNVNIWNDEGELLEPGRRLFFALDYDLVEIIPDAGSFGNWLVQTIDFLHLPSPALQITPDVRFYLLYPVEF